MNQLSSILWIVITTWFSFSECTGHWSRLHPISTVCSNDIYHNCSETFLYVIKAFFLNNCQFSFNVLSRGCERSTIPLCPLCLLQRGCLSNEGNWEKTLSQSFFPFFIFSRQAKWVGGSMSSTKVQGEEAEAVASSSSSSSSRRVMMTHISGVRKVSHTPSISGSSCNRFGVKTDQEELLSKVDNWLHSRNKNKGLESSVSDTYSRLMYSL